MCMQIVCCGLVIDRILVIAWAISRLYSSVFVGSSRSCDQSCRECCFLKNCLQEGKIPASFSAPSRHRCVRNHGCYPAFTYGRYAIQQESVTYLHSFLSTLFTFSVTIPSHPLKKNHSKANNHSICEIYSWLAVLKSLSPSATRADMVFSPSRTQTRGSKNLWKSAINH